MDKTIYQHLDTCGISYRRFDHPPVFTCEEANLLLGDVPGMKTKNLFLRNKKGTDHFLIVVPDEKMVDLEKLGQELGTTRLSMASPERLNKHLQVEPGSVSLLALFNDCEKKVKLVMDHSVWEAEALQCHPLVNTTTLVINKELIRKYLSSLACIPIVINIPHL